MKSKDKIKNQIEKFVKEYFSLLGLDIDFSVSGEEEYYLLKIITKIDSAGLVIGNKGRNMFSFQTIINNVFRIVLKDKKIIVDVDGWRDRESERLKDLAEKTANRVLETSQPQTLYNLTASQRRIIHMYLSDKNVLTQSYGEGVDRYLMVSPK